MIYYIKLLLQQIFIYSTSKQYQIFWISLYVILSIDTSLESSLRDDSNDVSHDKITAMYNKIVYDIDFVVPKIL